MEWINTKDALPDKRQYVICFGECGNKIGHFFGFLIENQVWVIDGVSQFSFITITHWMPLPEPPKE